MKVFVLAGQSNMVGGGHTSEVAQDLSDPQMEALFFHDGEWIHVAPNLIQPGFGPEITFARAMTDGLGEPIGIVKHAAGGTNLAEQWDPDKPDSLYHQLKAKVEAAQASRPIEIAGMLWVQGEADSRVEHFAPQYQENLEELVRRSRKDFGNPDMPFIAGRVNPPDEWPGGPIFLWTDQVRDAIENADVPNYRYINLDDLPKRPDNLHYTPDGYVTMGERFAAAMLEMMGEK